MFSHSTQDKNFYRLILKIKRRSKTVDYIPVICNEILFNSKPKINESFFIKGEYRSRTVYDTKGNKHLELFVFVFEAIQTTERDVDFNTVQITGKIFKEPIFRLTPKGRKIVDVLLMIQRTQGKSDYIPCIFWGDEAEFVANEFKVGDNITIDGRLQSRKYSKIEDGKMLIKVAYEVSGKLLCQ